MAQFALKAAGVALDFVARDAFEEIAKKRGKDVVLKDCWIGTGFALGSPELLDEPLANAINESLFVKVLKVVAKTDIVIRFDLIAPLADGRGHDVEEVGFLFEFQAIGVIELREALRLFEGHLIHFGDALVVSVEIILNLVEKDESVFKVRVRQGLVKHVLFMVFGAALKEVNLFGFFIHSGRFDDAIDEELEGVATHLLRAADAELAIHDPAGDDALRIVDGEVVDLMTEKFRKSY